MTIIEIDQDIVDEWAPAAYVMNAQQELLCLRSDVVSELGDTPSDCHLKAAFLTAIDAIDLNLRKALL